MVRFLNQFLAPWKSMFCWPVCTLSGRSGCPLGTNLVLSWLGLASVWGQSVTNMGHYRASVGQSGASVYQSRVSVGQSGASGCQSRASVDQSRASVRQSGASVGQFMASMGQSGASPSEPGASEGLSRAVPDLYKLGYGVGPGSHGVWSRSWTNPERSQTWFL